MKPTISRKRCLIESGIHVAVSTLNRISTPLNAIKAKIHLNDKIRNEFLTFVDMLTPRTSCMSVCYLKFI